MPNMTQPWRRSLTWLGAVALLVVGTSGAAAQSEFNNNIKYDAGQDLQPVFEGWARVPNGTFDLYFGYLNRNWREQLAVPVGPNNTFSPGAPDRGQPTYFHTRTNRKVFIVNVPADFGKSELVWTLTANGKTRTTVGYLKADWEITPDGGAAGTTTTKEARSNKAPAIDVSPVGPAKVGVRATLAASANDDGLPVPRPPAKAAVGQETPPALAGGPKSPANVPWLNEAPTKRPDGLTVRWFVFRGPADATFDADHVKVEAGKATNGVVFTAPGQYTLRAAAEDGLLTSYKDVMVTVSK